MKFTVDTKELKAVCSDLKLATKIGSLSILSDIFFEVGDDEYLTATGTNLELSVMVSIDGIAIEPGRLCISAANVAKIVQNEKAKNITIASGKDFGAVLSTLTRYTVKGDDPDEYPQIPYNASIGIPNVTVYGEDFIKVIEKIKYAMSSEEFKYILHGAKFILDDNSLNLVGHNGHERLATAGCHLKTNDEPIIKEFIVPYDAVMESYRIFKKSDEITLTPVQSKSSVQLEIADDKRRILTRTVDGEYPPYQIITIKDKPSRIHYVEVDKKDLSEGLKALDFINKGNKNAGVRFTINGDFVIMESRDRDGLKAERTIDKLGGSIQTLLGVDPAPLQDAIKASDGDNIRFEFAAPVKADYIDTSIEIVGSGHADNPALWNENFIMPQRVE